MSERALASLIIGTSLAIRRLREQILRIAPSSIPVLIQGPTGSGKELVAEALHRASGRSGAFVPFNVCAIADAMFEDALFGHVRGAFTGALGDRRGYLAEADRGTVFLDEITGLAAAAQPKLLRALETRTFRPVGSTADRRSDFRIVAATNDDLGQLVRDGRFRADLAHRISGFVLRVPPLSERVDDVAPLAQHFAAGMQSPGGAPVELSASALELLAAHAWSGNVRELKHVVECGAALADDGRIGVRDIADLLARSAYVTHATGAEVAPLDRESNEIVAADRRMLEGLLASCDWDTEAAATRLGIHRSTLYRRMKRCGMRGGGPRGAPAPSRRHLLRVLPPAGPESEPQRRAV
jgi:DNA-binding NtrC family response regulator